MTVGTDSPAARAHTSRALLLVAVLLIAANLRATITGIGPLLAQIRRDEEHRDEQQRARSACAR